MIEPEDLPAENIELPVEEVASADDAVGPTPPPPIVGPRPDDR